MEEREEDPLVKVRKIAVWGACLLPLLMFAGCGSGYTGPKLYGLSGKITINGQAPGGNYKVMLVGADPNVPGPSLIINDDGSYQATTAHGGKGLPGAAAGKYKVVLEAMGGGESAYGPGATGGPRPGAVPGTAQLPQDLAAFANAETSTKEIEVKTSKNEIDIVIP